MICQAILPKDERTYDNAERMQAKESKKLPADMRGAHCLPRGRARCGDRFLGLKFLKVTIVPEGDSLGCQRDRKYSDRFWQEGGLSPYMLDRLGKIIKGFLAGGIAERIASGRSNMLVRVVTREKPLSWRAAYTTMLLSCAYI